MRAQSVRKGQIISVSGRPGSGKSTLCAAIANELACSVIQYDAYEGFTRHGPEFIQDWLSRGAPYAEIHTYDLRRDLDDLAHDGPVIFDTPLGRAHPDTGPVIDISIWIECPADVALKRKIDQLRQGVPAGEEAAFELWLTGFLSAQDAIVEPACAVQRERVSPLADLIVDGRKSSSECLAISLTEIRNLSVS